MCAKNVAVKGMLIDLSLLNFLLEVIELHYISKNIHEFLEDEYTFYVIKYFLVFFATIRDMAKISIRLHNTPLLGKRRRSSATASRARSITMMQ